MKLTIERVCEVVNGAPEGSGMFLWWFDNQQSGVPEAILEVQVLWGDSN